MSDLVPFVHVVDVGRSIAFYRRLGFELRDTYERADRLDWASMQAGAGRLMLARADAAIDRGNQALLFYLYARDLGALREHLVAQRLPVGEIVDGTPGPRREMGLRDPNGYCLMIAENEHRE